MIDCHWLCVLKLWLQNFGKEVRFGNVQFSSNCVNALFQTEIEKSPTWANVADANIYRQRRHHNHDNPALHRSVHSWDTTIPTNYFRELSDIICMWQTNPHIGLPFFDHLYP
jgi:hypothetical protein